jgi:hypothetical protein
MVHTESSMCLGIKTVPTPSLHLFSDCTPGNEDLEWTVTRPPRN